MTKPNRPLAPHLQIYKPQLTSVLSILHRCAGLFLLTTLLGGVAWLWTLAQGEASYDHLVTCVFKPFYGSILTMGWIIAFCFHLANGLRHLVWDAGCGYELKAVYRGGWAVVLFTAVASTYLILKVFS
jgi:succinate dehydrogenase / fumarate reductase cytochrome b subunit